MISSGERSPGRPVRSTSLLTISILSDQFVRPALHRASQQAFSSTSIPMILANGLRCATINDRSPEPHPASMTETAFSHSVHAPSNTPSVPTFMAQWESSISNCLNENISEPESGVVNIQSQSRSTFVRKSVPGGKHYNHVCRACIRFVPPFFSDRYHLSFGIFGVIGIIA